MANTTTVLPPASITVQKPKTSDELSVDYLQTLQSQYDTINALPSKLQAAYESGKTALQTQAAQSLAQSSAVRGGRGLAAARGTAIAMGTQQSQLGTENEINKAAALQEAAKANTALIEQKKKMLDANAQKGAQTASATAEAMTIIDEESGTFVTTDADRQRMKNRFDSEVAPKYASNPAALAAAVAAFNNGIKNGTTELLGST